MISIYMYSCTDLDPGLDPLHHREYPDLFKLSNIPIPGKHNFRALDPYVIIYMYMQNQRFLLHVKHCIVKMLLFSVTM